MGLANLIASHSAVALTLIKQYIGVPWLAGVPISATRFRRSTRADVARHVLIDLTAGKQYVNDNVAPGPRTWEIAGYIGGLPLELTSLFMPSLNMFRDMIDKAYYSRQLVDFMDPDFKRWKVVIERFEYEKEPDTQNRLTIAVTLSEINVLTALIAPGDPSGLPSAPASGTEAGLPVAAGTVEAVVPDNTSQLIKAAEGLTGEKIPDSAFKIRGQ